MCPTDCTPVIRGEKKAGNPPIPKLILPLNPSGSSSSHKCPRTYYLYTPFSRLVPPLSFTSCSALSFPASFPLRNLWYFNLIHFLLDIFYPLETVFPFHKTGGKTESPPFLDLLVELLFWFRHSQQPWIKLLWSRVYMDFSGGSGVKICLLMQETRVQSLIQEDALEKEMATHSSIPAWEISWTRGNWQAAVHGVAKSRTWQGLSANTRVYKHKCLIWEMKVEKILPHLFTRIWLFFLLKIFLKGHFSNQGKAVWKQKVLTILLEFLYTGFFFRVDVLCMYPKGNLNLIYLISYNKGFWNNKSSSTWLL